MHVLGEYCNEYFDWTHSNISAFFSRLDPVTRDHLCFHVLHVTLSCLVALGLACQSSFSSSFLFDFSRFSFSSNLIFPSSLFSVSDPCSDTWIEAWFVISISMLSSSISLLWPQLTHITHISSQIVGPTMGTLFHLSFISWLGKSPTHSDCRMYVFCSDSPNSQVLLRAPQMLCSIRRQIISNLSPPMRWFLLTNIRQPGN